MWITVVGATALPDLLPLVRAYCDFYQVAPSDRELLELARALLADPRREGLQLLARDDTRRGVRFAPLGWSSARRAARPGWLGGRPETTTARRPSMRGLGPPAMIGGWTTTCRSSPS